MPERCWRLARSTIKAMKFNLTIAALAALTLGAATYWVVSAPRPAFSAADAAALDRPGDAERGRLVFAAGNCASCHASPGQPDRLRLGGGLALASPFGTLRVPNISPDRSDGIGNWRTVDLANALLSGVSPTQEHYYPALPYPSYVRMTIEDVRDLMAYLQTLQSVSGRAPPHELPAAFRIRRLIGVWKFLFFDGAPFASAGSHDDMWRRGRYLVEGLAHCAECHSSRNFLGGIKSKTHLAGGPDPEGTGFIPNITPAQIGDWSEDDIVELLTSGHTRMGNPVGSTMRDVVTNTAMLPPSDRRAIAVYLKSLPPRPTPHP
jgi:mono/diheme cytochrome c family protein